MNGEAPKRKVRIGFKSGGFIEFDATGEFDFNAAVLHMRAVGFFNNGSLYADCAAIAFILCDGEVNYGLPQQPATGTMQ